MVEWHNYHITFTYSSGVIYVPFVCIQWKLPSSFIKMRPLGFLIVKSDSLYSWLWHSTSFNINDNIRHTVPCVNVSISNWRGVIFDHFLLSLTTVDHWSYRKKIHYFKTEFIALGAVFFGKTYEEDIEVEIRWLVTIYFAWVNLFEVAMPNTVNKSPTKHPRTLFLISFGRYVKLSLKSVKS